MYAAAGHGVMHIFIASTWVVFNLLLVLSITDSRAYSLQPRLYIVYFSLRFCQFFLPTSCWSVIRCVIVHLVFKLLTHSLPLIDFFDLNSILSDISIATPHFYYYHGIFFSTLSIFLCLNLVCVFCRWLVVGSCLYSLCQSPSFDQAA